VSIGQEAILMIRYAVVLACAASCVATHDDPEVAAIESAAASLSFSREHVSADIYHYELVLPLGSGPNAAIRVHRIVREIAPYVPRRSDDAVVLMHGDFSTFVTNFAPALGEPASPVTGLAPYLAARNIDVWGVDRRWTLPAPEDDVSDFATMGVAQEVDDLRIALTLVRTVRAADGSGGGKVALGGYSHGAQLAYIYASVEAARPAPFRHVDALVPLDFYGAYGPESAADQAAACENSALGYQFVADGFIDSDNSFQILIGELARTAPDEPFPLNPVRTNRAQLLRLVGQTYLFAPLAPLYHLLAPILDENGVPLGLSETSEAAAIAWLEGSPFHESFLEAVDFDAQLCGATPPVDAPLSRIRVPLFYIGAAGGVGDLGIHSTQQVSSTDVTTLVVRRFGPERRAEDFGHADLLYADDAAALAWQPLVAWLAAH
jgi:hypothetical protein